MSQRREKISTHVEDTLRNLENGVNTDQALDKIESGGFQGDIYDRYYLRVWVTNMDEGEARLHIRIPLRMLKVGLDLGAGSLPELSGFDLHKVIGELNDFGMDRSLRLRSMKTRNG